jgi:hypothetical protein
MHLAKAIASTPANVKTKKGVRAGDHTLRSTGLERHPFDLFSFCSVKERGTL